MKPSLSPCLVLAVLSLLGDVAFAQSAATSSVASLQTMYEDKVKLDILRPHELAVADLNTKFAAALDRAQETAQKSGNLDEAVAIKKEKEAVLAGGYSPSAAEDPKTPASIKTLRTTYRNTVAKLELERDKRWQPLKEALARSLNGVIDTLTKSGKLDEAILAKKLREELLAAKTGPKANGVANSPALSADGKTFVNTLGMKFVPVPGTTILMCIHETRRQDYAAYAQAVPTIDSSWKNQEHEGIPCGHEDAHPVVGVSWDDAQGFCEWLSKTEGKTYRLPTDREWSIAVGIGRAEKWTKEATPEMLNDKLADEFPWGDDFPPKTKDQPGNYADSAWKEKFPTEPFLEGLTDGFATTAPVMSFKPSKTGIFDMGGNVWEWIDDWWNEEKSQRTLRGGAWSYNERTSLLSTHRSRRKSSDRLNAIGFRCVVAIGP
ncbi:MAG TPA: hypothetical protein DDZ88_16785 [Verrucomicrobiales bacterium]|nr:hypothetical protein [Verrucomicrobiales bacterium]